MDHLGLVQTVDGLGQRIVVGVADAAHRRFQAGLDETLGVANRHVLGPPVAVMYRPIRANRLARVQRLLQRVEHEVSPRRRRSAPPDDPAREDINDEGHVDEALPSGDVGKSLTHSAFGRSALMCRCT